MYTANQTSALTGYIAIIHSTSFVHILPIAVTAVPPLALGLLYSLLDCRYYSHAVLVSIFCSGISAPY